MVLQLGGSTFGVWIAVCFADLGIMNQAQLRCGYSLACDARKVAPKLHISMFPTWELLQR